jgi:hypothetical protein
MLRVAADVGAWRRASRGRGTPRITGITLGNLVPSARDRLETLDFDAELRLDVLIH